MKNRIVIASSVHDWLDTRIFDKEAISLSEKYETILLAPGPYQYKMKKGVHVINLNNWKRYYQRIIIHLQIWKLVYKLRPTIFHFHDPELMIVAFAIKYVFKARIIYDVHEDIKKQLQTKESLNITGKWVLIKFVTFVEALFLKYFDNLILAEDSYLQTYYTFPTTIIHNFPREVRLPKRDKTANRVVYIGKWIETERGILEILEAVNSVIKDGYHVVLDIFGKFHDESMTEKRVNEYLRGNGRNIRVNFLGYVPVGEILPGITNYLAGLVCLHPSENFINSYPTKMFEYMIAGLPVIASNFPLWSNIINENRCGICVNPLHSQEISGAIKYLLEHPEETEQMGLNGQIAVKTKYIWETEAKKLMDLYHKLM